MWVLQFDTPSEAKAAVDVLQGRVLSGLDFIDGDDNPADGHGHGTHVSSTIVDCVGASSVKILPVRVLDEDGSGSTSTVAAGIKYAVSQGADVINLSLGGGHSSILDEMVRYATGHNSLVVAAAGNDSINTDRVCPAHMTASGVVVVSAGDSYHNRANFSNYGAGVDLMAPGVDILAAVPGGYARWSGTSMAAPHVSAAAALLDLATGNTLSPGELEQKLCSATDGNGTWSDTAKGYGFLDMSRVILDPTAQPRVSISLREPVYGDDWAVELALDCSYSNTTLETIKFYTGKSTSGMVEAFAEDITSDDAGSYHYSRGASMKESNEGSVWYYQFGIVAGGTEYKSEIGTITKKPAAQPDSVTITIKDPTEFTADYIRMNMECSYTGTAPDTAKPYMSTTRSGLNNDHPIVEKITPRSSPFTYSYGIGLSDSSIHPGDVWYYQFGVVVNGVEYKSEAASFTIKERGQPQQTAPSKEISFQVSNPSYLEISNTMMLSAKAFTTEYIKSVNVYTNWQPRNGGEWVKIGTTGAPLSLGYEKHISYQLDLSGYTNWSGPCYYRFGAVLQDGSEYMSESNYFTAQLPEKGEGSASIGKVERDSAGRVSVYVDYNMKSGEQVESVIIRQGECRGQVGGSGEVSRMGQLLPAKGSYLLNFGFIPKGEYRYFQLEFYSTSKFLYRTKCLSFTS